MARQFVRTLRTKTSAQLYIDAVTALLTFLVFLCCRFEVAKDFRSRILTPRIGNNAKHGASVSSSSVFLMCSERSVKRIISQGLKTMFLRQRASVIDAGATSLMFGCGLSAISVWGSRPSSLPDGRSHQLPAYQSALTEHISFPSKSKPRGPPMQ